MARELSAHGIALVRAGADDQAALERLQNAAYARNRAILSVEPLPLQADYAAIFRDHEVWVERSPASPAELDAALILATARPDDILIWSVSTAPAAQNQGRGRALLACAEMRARALGRDQIRLYTGKPLTHLIDWYGSKGYIIERLECLPDRTIVHMLKSLV